MKELYIKPSTEIILSRLQLLAPQSMEIEQSEDDYRTIQTADEFSWDDDGKEEMGDWDNNSNDFF